jgi:glycosyltransferase involved in cell wall biosynthesis
MRISIVLPYPVFGAAEDYAAILACGLQRAADVDVVVVFLDGSIPDATARAFAAADVDSVALSEGAMNSIRHLRRALLSIEPDIVHVNQVFLPAIMAGGLLSGSATIVTAHNPALRPTYSVRGRVLSAIGERSVDCWIVLSARNEALLRSAHSTTKQARVIPPGLPIDRFDRPLTRRDARHELALPLDGFILGTVGRLARQKRHDLLIRGAAAAASTVSDLYVAILGEGELREETQRLADELMPGRLRLLGHRADVARLLPAFDAFALPSDYEGLSFAMLEAMAVGLPIIATDVQGSGEALTDGVNGLLVPSGGIEELAFAIRQVAQDPEVAVALGRKAAETFQLRYTADRMIEETLALYGEVCR